MQYHFLGATYEHDATVVPVSEGQEGGKYRGANWKTHVANVPSQHRAPRQLCYRGVMYS
ncbi:hypothetical protein GlitD10_1236 [Gloeomargarita lithophora Alchichica-D10]|uniref:DUF4278 domain-containing protein n=1 Tax=Gloeomargarita lithophora Alchichica-D10 TaxID=1188229 RepID=A0A1J0AC75_9CYAN|nr:DUF4278 domain-containing protein [Gloeomargarita lithophora]APB33556.1 hypothetical protein GlitD10_1236 [Gloeomargarita lithophora Alchichica-D10]